MHRKAPWGISYRTERCPQWTIAWTPDDGDETDGDGVSGNPRSCGCANIAAGRSGGQAKYVCRRAALDAAAQLCRRVG
jgi:hypothetical protein